MVPLSPFSPLQNFEFFDKFAEGAKAATEKNKKGFLEELLRHEDDPLYFLRAGMHEHYFILPTQCLNIFDCISNTYDQ